MSQPFWNHLFFSHSKTTTWSQVTPSIISAVFPFWSAFESVFLAPSGFLSFLGVSRDRQAGKWSVSFQGRKFIQVEVWFFETRRQITNRFHFSNYSLAVANWLAGDGSKSPAFLQQLVVDLVYFTMHTIRVIHPQSGKSFDPSSLSYFSAFRQFDGRGSMSFLLVKGWRNATSKSLKERCVIIDLGECICICI